MLKEKDNIPPNNKKSLYGEITLNKVTYEKNVNGKI